MQKTKTLSCRISPELDKEIEDYSSNSLGIKDKTSAVISLLEKGLLYDKKQEEMSNLFEYGILASYHLLREIALTRGEDFLEKSDEDFGEKKDHIKQMVTEWGLGYGRD